MISKSLYTAFILLLCIMMIVSCKTRRGIETVELPVPSDPTISFRVWFKVGSQDDPAGKEGLAALTAAMLTEASTQENKYSDIIKKLYPMAAYYSSAVDKEMTIIKGRVHKDKVKEYLDLFIQAILYPAFEEEDFNRIKTNTLNYLEKTLRYSNDEAFGKELLYREIFKGTPYGHPEEGLIQSVKSITLEHVRNFYKTHFTRDNVVIGIGGNYSSSILKKLKMSLEQLPPRVTRPVEKPKPRPINGLEVVLVEKETQSTAISIGFPIDVLRGDKDYYALWIANSWFGEHRNSSSHLYQVIREARGMNYGDYSYIECFPNGWARQFPPANVSRRQQIFEIWIRPVLNEHAHFALRAAIRELQKLVDNGMTEEDFELTKRFLKKYYLHYASTTDMRLGYKIDDLFYGIDDHLKKLPEMLDMLTLDDVNSAIKKHLQYKNMKIVMITKNGKELKEALVKNLPSPIKYATPKPEKVLIEDKEIEGYRLKIDESNVKIVKADDVFVR